MSGLVLIVGALLLAGGGYEMLAGSGDILSERGWSAFIAGSTLVAGGVVTLALGIVVRAVERLRGAVLEARLMPGTIAAAAEHTVSGLPAAVPLPVAPAVVQPDLFHDAAFEKVAPAPVLAASPIELDHAREPYPEAAPAAAPPPRVEPEHPPSSPDDLSKPDHDDWLDHSFADLQREMTVRHDPVPAPPQPEPKPVPAAAADKPVAAAAVVEPLPAPSHDPYVPSLVHEEPAVATQTASADLATISAREETAPTASPVIGRYESEGTSYVMYADGSIDAQSEAGVYRFSSMAELKSFIET